MKRGSESVQDALRRKSIMPPRLSEKNHLGFSVAAVDRPSGIFIADDENKINDQSATRQKIADQSDWRRGEEL